MRQIISAVVFVFAGIVSLALAIVFLLGVGVIVALNALVGGVI